MTKIITIAAQNAPKAVGPYSQARKAVEAEATLYVSGQLPINPATGTMPATIEEQTRQSLDNLGAILKEAGMDYSDIVKTKEKNFYRAAVVVAHTYVSSHSPYIGAGFGNVFHIALKVLSADCEILPKFVKPSFVFVADKH